MIPPPTTNIVLPLAVSLFKIGSSIGGVVYVLFTAHLYHIERSSLQMVILFCITNCYSIGRRRAFRRCFFFIPIMTQFIALGLLLQMASVLFDMDTVPDMLGPTTNVTADMTAVAIVGKRQKLIVEKDVT